MNGMPNRDRLEAELRTAEDNIRRDMHATLLQSTTSRYIAGFARFEAEQRSETCIIQDSSGTIGRSKRLNPCTSSRFLTLYLTNSRHTAGTIQQMRFNGVPF